MEQTHQVLKIFTTCNTYIGPLLQTSHTLKYCACPLMLPFKADDEGNIQNANYIKHDVI